MNEFTFATFAIFAFGCESCAACSAKIENKLPFQIQVNANGINGSKLIPSHNTIEVVFSFPNCIKIVSFHVNVSTGNEFDKSISPNLDNIFVIDTNN